MACVAVHSVVKVYFCAVGWELATGVVVPAEFDVVVEVEDVLASGEVVEVDGSVHDALPHSG